MKFVKTWLNFLLENEKIPGKLKLSLIISLFKGDDKDPKDTTSYRPISLLPSIFKILEAIVNRRLMRYLKQKNLINAEQAGFQEDRSTLENLFVLDQCFEKANKLKQPIYVAFLDISKAFDKAWRNGLLRKLANNGVTGKLLRLIGEFYTETKSMARLQEGISREFETTAGVMQGSMLSPTLFNLLLNEIVETMNDCNGFKIEGITVKMLLYADDIVLISDCRNDLQKMIKKCENYGNRWRFQFSASKTKLISNRAIEEEILMYDEKLKQVDWYPYLGMPITAEGIDWQKYIMNASNFLTRNWQN